MRSLHNNNNNNTFIDNGSRGGLFVMQWYTNAILMTYTQKQTVHVECAHLWMLADI